MFETELRYHVDLLEGNRELIVALDDQNLQAMNRLLRQAELLSQLMPQVPFVLQSPPLFCYTRKLDHPDDALVQHSLGGIVWDLNGSRHPLDLTEGTLWVESSHGELHCGFTCPHGRTRQLHLLKHLDAAFNVGTTKLVVRILSGLVFACTLTPQQNAIIRQHALLLHELPHLKVSNTPILSGLQFVEIPDPRSSCRKDLGDSEWALTTNLDDLSSLPSCDGKLTLIHLAGRYFLRPEFEWNGQILHAATLPLVEIPLV